MYAFQTHFKHSNENNPIEDEDFRLWRCLSHCIILAILITLHKCTRILCTWSEGKLNWRLIRWEIVHMCTQHHSENICVHFECSVQFIEDKWMDACVDRPQSLFYSCVRKRRWCGGGGGVGFIKIKTMIFVSPNLIWTWMIYSSIMNHDSWLHAFIHIPY